MKKIFSFLLLGLMCSIGNLWADTEIFSYTVVNPAKGSYTATGGTAECTTAMASSGSNEITIGNQTFYKFNSSSAWTFTLSSGTFLVGDVVSFTCACTTSAKTGKGIEIQTSPVIAVTGDFPASTANTISYTVVAGDGIAGQSSFSIKRNDSDIKFGTVSVTRAATYTVTYYANGGTGSMDPTNNEIVANAFIAPAGQAFTGWNTAADGNGDAYKAGDAVTSNLNLYAQWATVYTVTYKANGGTGDDVVDNQAVAIAANTFTAPAGKTFLRWNTAADGSGTTYAVGADVESNLTLYAQWATIFGELIKAVHTGATTATVTGVVGGTVDKNTQSGGKLGSDGHYFGVKLAEGGFMAGDTVVIQASALNGGNTATLFSDKGTNALGSEAFDADTKVAKVILSNTTTWVYLYRASSSCNPTVEYISVVRPMPEKSRSAAEITSVEIDNVALDAASLSTLKTNHSFASVEEYVEAPAVKFFTSVTVTYEDDSQKVIDEEIVANVTEDPVGTWKAVANINEVNYIITAVKPTSYTVTYKYGETVIGDELVAAGGHPAEYAAAQSMQLASFNGWFSDAELTSPVDPAAAVINANTEFYASFSLLFASSINIEAYALRNGKSEANTNALVAQMGAQHYASNFAYNAGNNEIDYLNDSKDNRNYAYLGLKIKSAGTMFNFRVASGNTVKVKFGNVGKTPLVSINGSDYANMVITDHVYSYTAVADALISIKTADASAVVLQQIAIGEELAASEYEVEITLGENGYSTFATDYKYTVDGAEVYKAAYNGSDAVVLTEVVDAVVPANAGIILKGTAGEIVTLTASGSAATELADNGLVGVVAPLAASAGMYVLSTNAGITEFNPCEAGVMIPAHKAYISIPSNAPAVRIIFAENGATGINELEGAEKAVKLIENGKLYIQKDGVVYDATGAKVK